MIGQELGQKIAEKKTVKRVKRHWLTIAFFLGFVVDNLTLNRVDQLFDNLILASYVLLGFLSLYFLYASAAEKFSENINGFFRKYAPVVVQYSFGGLLSGMLIFYGRSGAWIESWPFLMVFLVVIYFNETLKDRTGRLIYNLAILFIGLFSYIVLVIPVLTGLMGPWVFVGSGVLALIVMHRFILILTHVIPRFLHLHMRAVVFTIGSIFAGFNFLYFANIIPPIPLSLIDAGVYHSVVRFDTGEYQLKYEAGRWWEPFKDSDDTFHPQAGDDVYCFARVFAPTRISTDIYHTWEYYDPDTGEWVEHVRLNYAIAGGRGSGYRGYTLIQNYTDGKWRCSVETERGQVLGRESFTIDSQGKPGELVTRTE